MTENMLDMSASAKATEASQKEPEHPAKHEEEQLPQALTRPLAEELEVARELCVLRGSGGRR